MCGFVSRYVCVHSLCVHIVCLYVHVYVRGVGQGQGSRATIFAESADWIPYIFSFIDLLLLANCCIYMSAIHLLMSGSSFVIYPSNFRLSGNKLLTSRCISAHIYTPLGHGLYTTYTWA